MQRFYGGPPMAWLEMPLGVVKAYLQNLPMLRAESALEGVSVALIGSGNMEKRHAQGAIGDWQQIASGPMERPVMSEEERREFYENTGWFQVEVMDG